jgi:hypothetical protein
VHLTPLPFKRVYRNASDKALFHSLYAFVCIQYKIQARRFIFTDEGGSSMWANTDDAVLATIDAIKSICELLHARGVVSVDEFALTFEHQAKGYLAEMNPDGVAVMLELLTHLGSRQQVEGVLQAFPKCTA